MKQTEIPDRIDKATGTDTPAPLLIRHAVPEDFPAILAIYARARAFMKAHGNPRQWNDTWPPETLLREDIRLGRMYVAVAADEIAAVFVYIQGVDIDPSYRLIENGAWGNPGEYCLNWAFAQCHHLRVDTHADNLPMQRLLGKLGFTQRGIIYVREDHDPRLAYDKF